MTAPQVPLAAGRRHSLAVVDGGRVGGDDGSVVGVSAHGILLCSTHAAAGAGGVFRCHGRGADASATSIRTRAVAEPVDSLTGAPHPEGPP